MFPTTYLIDDECRKMKLVMLNDCAGVGETLLRYMPTSVDKQHIKRTRGLWSKTFGVAYKILRTNGDVYHSNYILQDCYLAIRMGKKPIVGWALGSDLRTSLNHKLWGRIVRHNATNCSKLMVSTPDILGIAKRFREDAAYFPPAFDPELFYPKPRRSPSDTKKVLIASNVNWMVKGTDLAVRGLAKIKDKVDVSIIKYGADFERTQALASSLDLHLNVLEKTSRTSVSEYYWNADVVVDQFTSGCAGMVSLEAIACGRPAVTYVSSEYPEYGDFSVKDIRTEDDIAEAVMSANEDVWKKQHEYLVKNHEVNVAVKRLLDIYRSLRVSR